VDPVVLAEIVGTWGCLALLVLLLLTGIGSPIPEDLLLLVGGYLVFTGVIGWPLTLTVSLVGVVGSDTMLYSAGRHLAWRPRRSLEEHVLSPSRLRRVTRWFDRIGPTAVFAARLVPGTRALVFVTAGLRGLPASRFLIYDLLGALIWVPLLLFLGHRLGDRIGDLSSVVRWTQDGSLWLATLAVTLLALWLVWGQEESKL
jgi:membrane protein DedA with SNARE-associated domain